MASMHADIPRKTFLVRFVAVVVALLVILAAAGFPLVASAASAGSITLDCRVNGVPLVGDTYGFVRVADVTYDEAAGTITSYATRDAFASFGYDWPNMKASELDEAAKALASHAGEENLYERTAASDASGSVGLWGLEPGFYLVARIATADANAGYACDPLLITVPLVDGGQLDWSVTSQPKFGEPEPDEPDKPEKPDEPESPSVPSKPKNPWELLAETGDIAFVGIGALLVLGGIAVILGGSIYSRSKADSAEAVSGDDSNGSMLDDGDLSSAGVGEIPDSVSNDVPKVR